MVGKFHLTFGGTLNSGSAVRPVLRSVLRPDDAGSEKETNLDANSYMGNTRRGKNSMWL